MGKTARWGNGPDHLTVPEIVPVWAELDHLVAALGRGPDRYREP